MYQVETRDDITVEYLGKTIHDFKREHQKDYIDRDEYAKGNNPVIMGRVLPDDSGPDNRIPVSYARRIVNLVVGYMYKAGLINYAYDGDGDGDKIQPVFDLNMEPIKTAQMGREVSVHGVGYEYHYVDGKSIPRFVKLPAAEVVPIYDKQIEPQVLGFARFYPKDDDHLHVMFVDDRQIYEFTMLKDGDVLEPIGEPEPHFYKRVPLVVFKNNEEKIGDFEPVQPLIDAYDVLLSDSMNEFDRFSWAYLLLKGMSLTAENAEALKRMRVFENLEDTSDVSFLTKDIDTEFIKFMSDLIRNEIHRQSGIPNLEDYDASGASGKTMTKFIYLMELFTDPKESYFKIGLLDRFDCLNRIMRIQGKQIDPMKINVIMNRNKPDNSMEQAEIFNQYAGHISEKTLIENFADFVDDVDAELEQIEEEKAAYPEIDIDTRPEQEPVETG